jgi:hypothetical protein
MTRKTARATFAAASRSAAALLTALVALGAASAPALGAGSAPALGAGSTSTLGAANTPTLGAASAPALGAASTPTLGTAVPVAAPAATPATGEALSLLPTSAYQPEPVCSPPAPGHASCMALELLPKAGAAPPAVRAPLGLALPARGATHSLTQTHATQVRTGYAAGQTPEPVFPEELRDAYHLPTEPVIGSSTQTIALVDAYNDVAAEADLKVYDESLSIKSECTRKDGCFRKVNQNGVSVEEGASGNPFPKSAKELQEREATCRNTKAAGACSEVEEASGWGVEISTDIDVAHSLCQSCHILLVEADSAEYSDLETAEDTAVRLGATEVSNSWDGPEPGGDSDAFNHPDTVITAAAGDDGYLNWTQAEADKPGYFAGAAYPASSPHVVAVGGTELTLTSADTRQSETVWNEDPNAKGNNEGAGGGACSERFSAPEWQQQVPDWTSVGCETGVDAKRAVADVAADADPETGVIIYDSHASKEYLLVIGGTSVASPIVASVFALAGGAHGVDYPAQTLYSHLGSPSLYDVTEGGNGKCDDVYTDGCSGSSLSPLDCGAGVLICNAADGYDGPTGVGAPNGIAAFAPGSEEEQAQRAEEARREAERKQAEETKRAEEKRVAEEKQAAEERRVAEERRAEERKAEEKREAESKQAEEAKLAEEERRAIEELDAGKGTGVVLGGNGSGLGGGTGTGTNSGSQGAGASTIPSGSQLEKNAGSQGAGASTVRLSGLALTARTSALIAHALPTRAQLVFTFTLSAPARVRVVLTRRVRVRGHTRWAKVPGTFSFTGSRGRNRLHLRGGTGTLEAGRYRLTLTPAHGRARTLELRLR